MTDEKSPRENLKKLLEMTTILPDKCHQVGEPLNINKLQIRAYYGSIRIYSDGRKLLEKLSNGLQNYVFNVLNITLEDIERKGIVGESFAKVLTTYDEKKLELARKDPENFYKEIKSVIKKEVSLFGEKKYVFGCHLSMHDLEPIIIGPVRFEPRLTWLKRTKKEGRLPWADISYFQGKWDLDNSEMKENTKALVDSVGESKYVCSVDLKRSTGDIAGHFVALRAARLALTTIALGFPPVSRTMEHMYLTWDEKSDIQHLFIIGQDDYGFETNRSRFPGGNYHSRQVWDDLSHNMEPVYQAAGQVIEWFVEGSKESKITKYPLMKKTLLHALLWFYQGCQEKDFQMSIHHFMASLDSLANGNKRPGIETLLKNKKFQQELVDDIGKMYDKDRSRFSHGNHDRIGHISNTKRDKAEFATRKCLGICLHKFTNYNEDDNPEYFTKLTLV